MRITYKYKLLNSADFTEIELTKDTYFDSISEEQNFEEDGVPMHNDGRDYCPNITNHNFEWGEIIISGSKNNDTSIRTEYYNARNSYMIYRKDKDGYELIIQSIMIKSELIYTSRMERKNKNSLWENINLSAGFHPEGGPKEEWFNLKKGELVK